MSYLQHLIKTNHNKDTRWIVKTTSKGLIREVKEVYEPLEYKGRELHTKEKLIKILKDAKGKRS
jgi:hypothetical protein